MGLYELLWQSSKTQLTHPGKGTVLEAGYVSSFDSSKPFFICHHRPHGDHPVLALWKHSMSGKVRLAVGVQSFSEDASGITRTLTVKTRQKLSVHIKDICYLASPPCLEGEARYINLALGARFG